VVQWIGSVMILTSGSWAWHDFQQAIVMTLGEIFTFSHVQPALTAEFRTSKPNSSDALQLVKVKVKVWTLVIVPLT